MLNRLLGKFYNRSLHRTLLDREIAARLPQLTGRVLNAGDRGRRYDSFFSPGAEVVAVDLKPLPDTGVIQADICRLPFPDNHFDAAVSFEVMEYVAETGRALAELARVLKDDGQLIFSVPFLDPVHGDIDSVRYTHKAWREMLAKDFFRVSLKQIGGRFAVMFDFYFEKVRNRYPNYFKLLLWPVLFFLRKLALFLDKRDDGGRYPMGYFIECLKKRK